MKQAAGKLLYGALFVAVLPALLVLWARATEGVVRVAVPGSGPIGAALIVAGAALILSGWHALYHFGGGLPMNAFPPPRLVTRGPYAIVSHPIYAGASAIAFGVSMVTRSSSGFWLISPALTLASVALVLGYEKPDLDARFGAERPRPWLSLPPAEDTAPAIMDRLALYPTVILLWCALYEAVAAVGAPPDARSTVTAFEARIPVIEQTEIVYALAYPFVLLAPIVARSRRDLRALCAGGLAASALVFPIYLAVPLIAPPRPFTPAGPLGSMLALERSLDTPAAAFPSFHVIWALLAADAWASRWPRLRPVMRGIALLIAASCFTTGMHALADIAAGFAAYALVARRAAVWEALRRATERVANSWTERRVGPVRILGHGRWAAFATFTGMLLVGTLVGPDHLIAAFVAGVTSVVCAGLWAQIVEGSPSLLRPYGFYGGLLGIILGALLAPLAGTPVWLILGAYAAAGPWIQAAGRMRCLVQGCCHGHETTEAIGIRYTHPRSRVVRLSSLGGVPVHPTPLYSILWNGVSALVLGRLWTLHAPLSFVAGVYLLLNGVGRFVEEDYRGEPQTPVYAGLRFYQWVALAGAVAGAALTSLAPIGAAPSPAPSGLALAGAAIFAALAWFAASVDFPDSNGRFARLV